MSIIGDIWDVVTGVFSDVAGWAIDAVIGTITAWVTEPMREGNP